MVLHGKGDQKRIARATQQRILAAARQLGYTPNYFVRDMFLKRREFVTVGGAGAPEKVSALITPALSAAGYQVQVTSLAPDPAAAVSQMTSALKSGLVVVIGPSAEAGGAATASGEREAVSGKGQVPSVELEPAPRPEPVPQPAPSPAPEPVSQSAWRATITLPH